MADAGIAISEPGPGARPDGVEPQLEQEPAPEASGEPRAVHSFDVLEAPAVHDLSKGSFHAPQPVAVRFLAHRPVPPIWQLHATNLANRKPMP
jgi:hypothetical protein